MPRATTTTAAAILAIVVIAVAYFVPLSAFASAASPRVFHQHASTVRVNEGRHHRGIIIADDAPARGPAPARTGAASAAAGIPTPIDVRIEYHSVSTHTDLVIGVPHPRFSWQLADEYGSSSATSSARSVHQIAYCITVQPRASSLAGLTHDLWNSTRVPGSASLHVPYTGPALVSDTFYVWTLQYWSSTGAVSSIATGVFRTALLSPATDFQGVWIGSKTIRMNQLRKEFTLPAGVTVSQATIFYSGIGYSNLWLNGALVDPSRKLDPGWTTFEKRTLYVSFDLTSMLQPGTTNCLGIHLGNGWYSQEQYSAGQAEPSYGPPRLLLQLNIQLSDGTSLSVVSDTTWLGRQGEIMHDGVYHGEIYDSLAVRDGWSLPNFTDPLSVWIAPSQLPSPLDSDGVLSLQPMDPIRVGADALHVKTSAAKTGHDGRIAGVYGAPITQTTLTPVASLSCGSVPVLDLGQNFAGWCSIPFSGSSDVSVYMRHAEVFNPVGPSGNSFNSLYLDNLRNAANTDIYVMHGDRFTSQTYEPTFTVRGFRYMSMLGLQNSVPMQDVQCFPVHSETTLIGNFTTTNAVINQVQHNILWSQISNIMSLPTDCPQRDERKGWMGDAALSVDEALYNFDMAPFYENFLNLISDAQHSDGSVPDTVPLTFGSYPADPNWGTAYPTIAWTLYQHYGDVSVLKAHYAGLTAYIENLRAQYKSAGGLAHMPYRYGDWVPPPPHTMANSQLVSSYPFLRDVRNVASIAALVGDNSTAAEYTQLYANLTAEFHATFYNATSQSYADGFQASNVLALASPGVVPADVKAAVLQSLVSDIQQNDMHVTTGIIGTSQIFAVLSDNGHHDVSLELLSSTSYPSYGWMFNNEWENATTLWELWDSPLEGPEMDSRNHIMFGSVGSYFYTHLAGVELNALETIRIHPRMALDKVHLMDSCQAEVHTIKGAVLVDWSRDDQGLGSTTSGPRALTMHVSVPPNTRATVTFDILARVGSFQTLHDGETALWDRSGSAMSSVAGVSKVETLDSGALRAHIESGSYSFVAKWL